MQRFTMENSLLKIENLSMAFMEGPAAAQVLNHVGLDLEMGQVVALVGESGGGKSLTALASLGIIPEAATVDPASKLYFNLIDILRTPEYRLQQLRGREMAMIFQDPQSALNPVYRVGEQISEMLSNNTNDKKDKQVIILRLLQNAGIDDPESCIELYPHQLSGGMAQRVMVAMMMADQPKLLIADEPTSALDVNHQNQIIDLFLKLKKKSQMGLFLITHDLKLAAKVADQIVVIQKGKIIERQKTVDFFRFPLNDYSKKLIAAADLKSQNNKDKMIGEVILLIKNLTITVKNHAWSWRSTKIVDNVSLSVRQGETVALIGESGSGKSTIARAIMRLLRTASGSIIFENHDILKLNRKRHLKLSGELQIIFQDPYSALNPKMLIRDILLEGLNLFKPTLPLSEKIKLIVDELQEVGLTADVLTRFPHEFSGGQRQRICIAKALLLQPKLLICDEITTALDNLAQLQVLDLLKKIQAARRLSYLMITHNAAIVDYMADRVLVLRQGRIIEEQRLNG